MHAEEVDLTTNYPLLPHLKRARHPTDESDEFARRGGPDADMPVGPPAGGFQGPVQEGDGVVEAEHGLCVFDVIGVEEGVEVGQVGGGGEVEGYPVEAGDEGVGGFGDKVGVGCGVYGAGGGC